MNNGKYHTEQYKQKQAEKVDRKFGPLKTHIMICERCGEEYTFEGRIHTKAYSNSRFCSRSCANSTGGIAKKLQLIENGTATYRTICFHYYGKKCIVCGEENIVEVHHYDEDHSNNDPTNLVPLCPTHHQYVHSRYKDEILPFIEEWKKRQ